MGKFSRFIDKIDSKLDSLNLNNQGPSEEQHQEQQQEPQPEEHQESQPQPEEHHEEHQEHHEEHQEQQPEQHQEQQPEQHQEQHQSAPATTSSGFPLAAPAVSQGEISKKQLYQSRYNFGVNFGGVFVREKWIYHSTFPEDTENELDAVAKSAQENRDEARKTLEKHWKGYARDEDWEWLKGKGVNSIRVPLGYWNIDGGKYTSGTNFADYKDIYVNSWKIFKSHYIEPAAQRGISILVDIHGLPGGANKDAHSGEQGGTAGFWDSADHQKLLTKALAFVAKDLKGYENISGIQIVNESESSKTGRRQKAYYTQALKAIRKEDPSVPVIISDGWTPNQWVEWVQEVQGKGNSAGLVIDTHCYRCFSDGDKGKTPEEIIDALQIDLLTNLNDDGNGADIMVGEWSSVLDGQTWSNCGLDPNDNKCQKRKELATKFCGEQTKYFVRRAGAGSYFWTYKFESGNGGEWDFRQQAGRAFKAPRVAVPDESKLNEARDREYNAHAGFWDKENPNENYDHDRFKDGFTTAWLDSVAFAKAGSLIGRRQAVKAARLQQHVQEKGESPFVWEWDQGYDKGIKEFRKAM
ncbi:hypothetical protein JCM33374_g918 [Metschnikowia sp. JCM 33374]|nr:hypothetical protein JCM33374_g918 [Metschnikowia sp. JCM 33374]